MSVDDFSGFYWHRNVGNRDIATAVRDDASDGVANTIIEAALGAWRMRRTPAVQASMLSKLRRFMPAGPVDSILRKAPDGLT